MKQKLFIIIIIHPEYIFMNIHNSLSELLTNNMAANSAAISTKGSFPGSGSESLAKRAQTTIQDPVFQKMKQQFSIDFDFTLPEAMKLHIMISKMKKWIQILETKIRLLPK